MIRLAIADDYDALGQLMFDAIHAVPSPYSAAERNAWRAKPYAGADWHARLAQHHVLVAEDASGIVGFLTLSDVGYIDLGYVLPRGRGRGWFRKLYNRVEAEARKMNLKRLSTHASLAAEGPFIAMGFAVTEREVVEMDGQTLHRAAMEKNL